jgi:phosphohistidine phosphatase SixA
MKKFVLILLMVLLGQQSVNAQKTLKVWVVRHAEKLTDNPKERDPELSPIGLARAEVLKKYLGGQQIDSIFSTNYKRTKSTGFPLADKIGINIKTYTPDGQKALVKQLLANASGKKVLIIGHSNTVLEIVEAFGGVKPIKELIEESDYDYIFALTIKGDKVSVKVDHYGALHHSKE